MKDLAGYHWIRSCAICADEHHAQLTQAPTVNYYQCVGCQVIFLNPQPALETLRQQYTQKELMNTGPVSAWFKHKPFYVKAQERARVHDVVRYKRHGALLDIGCGMGDFCSVAGEVGFRIFGTEFSDTYAEEAKKRVSFAKLYIGRVQEIPFADAKFDVITLWHVLEHLPDPLETLARLRQLLNPGGIVCIEVPNVEQKRKRPMYRSDLEDYPVDRLEHLFYYSGHALEQACAKAGLKVLALKFVDAHQPSKNMVKHMLRKVKRPAKQILYAGRLNKAFSALRLFATTERTGDPIMGTSC